MAAKTNKTGTLIKEARTGAGLTQEKLAASIKGVSAQDISKAERGELMLTQETLKQIAKLTGVTQTSLINAAKEDTKPAAKKTEAKPAAKTTTAKTTAKKTETKPAA
ncbi:MAG: helix-turn-helix transcriptional regulator, partial [Clostridia bacterium]|nr:helix-turn-helix transcriptional regulator [Clostridia bacterium]